MDFKQFLKLGWKKLLVALLLLFASYFIILSLQEHVHSCIGDSICSTLLYVVVAKSFILPVLTIFPSGGSLVLFFSILYLYLLSCLIVSTLDVLYACIRINKVRTGVKTARVQMISKNLNNMVDNIIAHVKTARVEMLSKYLNNMVDNIIAHITLDNIKEFFSPNRWKVLITIVLSVSSFCILYLLSTQFLSNYAFLNTLGILAIALVIPCIVIFSILFGILNDLLLLILASLTSHYIWSCVFFSIYKIVAKRKTKREKIMILFGFFLVLFLVLRALFMYTHFRMSFS